MPTPKATLKAVPNIEPVAVAATGQTLLSMDDLVTLTDTPMSTLYSLFSSGGGPRRMKIGRSYRFRASDVDTWLESLVADREVAA
jgi:excisionase family DNA binding protein